MPDRAAKKLNMHGKWTSSLSVATSIFEQHLRLDTDVPSTMRVIDALGRRSKHVIRVCRKGKETSCGERGDRYWGFIERHVS